jgi:formyl-CoA transferase
VHGVSESACQAAPRIGEHNDEVLKELGFRDDEIDGLRTSGAIPGAQQGKNAEVAVRAS